MRNIPIANLEVRVAPSCFFRFRKLISLCIETTVLVDLYEGEHLHVFRYVFDRFLYIFKLTKFLILVSMFAAVAAMPVRWNQRFNNSTTG